MDKHDFYQSLNFILFCVPLNLIFSIFFSFENCYRLHICIILCIICLRIYCAYKNYLNSIEIENTLYAALHFSCRSTMH